jgi:hypothetical protein
MNKSIRQSNSAAASFGLCKGKTFARGVGIQG